MQIYHPSALTAGVQGALMRYIRAGRGSRFLGRIAMLETSSKASETHTWLGEAPRMRQIGDDSTLEYDGMSSTSYTLVNELWKAGLIIKRKHLDDQQNRDVLRRIQSLATVAGQHIDRLVINALINGDTTTCYDGANFFANSHAARGQQTAAQDNLLAGSGTTVANVQADLNSAIQQLMSFLAENNEPFDDMRQRFGVVYPVAMHGVMTEAIRAVTISNTTNARFDDFVIERFPTARLDADDVDDFVVCDMSEPTDLPIVIQQRDALEVASQTSGDDAFDKEDYKFQVRWRGKEGYAHWQRAVKVSN